MDCERKRAVIPARERLRLRRNKTAMYRSRVFKVPPVPNKFITSLARELAVSFVRVRKWVLGMTKKTENPVSPRRWLLENALALLAALAIVFALRSCLFEAFKIPSGSMMPALLIGDHVLVNKFAYGLKLPFTELARSGPTFITHASLPRRGDVIVFVFPKDETLFYIKRVVGLPGETVEVRNKELLIDGKPVMRKKLMRNEADKILNGIGDSRYSAANLEVYNEEFAKNPVNSHIILIDKSNYLGDKYGPVVVPQDSVFVLGDNRDFSNDSRFWGFVPVRNIRGRATAIWLSLWVNFIDNQISLRTERMGKLLD